jgi:transcriptional regulator EpsA
MDAYQARLLKYRGARRTLPHSWNGQAPEGAPANAPSWLSAEESARFVRIVSQGALISRHYAIYQWLSGEVQQVLPHQMLIAAWGDFTRRELRLDVTSALPGVRTTQIARCSIDDFVYKAHAEWIEGGRQPVLLETADFAPPRACGCPIHAALRSMRSAVVHGVRDERTGHESLYLALDSESPGAVARIGGFKFLVDCLIAQIDVAFRRLATFTPQAQPMTASHGGKWRDLSRREQEILSWLRRGESNVAIAAALDISPHTVKNHLQRIFRKIGVSNRTQAAAQYSEVMRSAAEPR